MVYRIASRVLAVLWVVWLLGAGPAAEVPATVERLDGTWEVIWVEYDFGDQVKRYPSQRYDGWRIEGSWVVSDFGGGNGVPWSATFRLHPERFPAVIEWQYALTSPLQWRRGTYSLVGNELTVSFVDDEKKLVSLMEVGRITYRLRRKSP